MDIKIITKNDTFLIYKPIATIQELHHELKRFKIQQRDILIYFYDNDADKVVILDDQDLIYAIEQGKEVKKKTLNFYIYYKLLKPLILAQQTLIKDGWLKEGKDQSPLSRESETFKSDPMLQSVPYNPQNSEIQPKNYEPAIGGRQTIIPIAIQVTREDKLKEVIDKFIDKMLYDQYEI